MWVDESTNRIGIDISHDDFVRVFQSKFSTGDAKITPTMSLVWFDSEGKAFDGTNGRPDLTNEFSLEITDKQLEEATENPCATAARKM
jgi:hypothetical protein